MSRNLVLCFDGTNNQFGHENTSVVRLAQVIERGPTTQRLYYDPGVGTLPEPGLFTRIGQRASEWFGLAFGTGLTRKVEQGYAYLMDYWEPGDKVFLFGFSRGAYAARVLAGLLHTLGLLPRGNHNLVPYVMRLYRTLRRSDGEAAKAGDYWQLCCEFRWTFARPVENGGDERHFPVHFLGLWDTVSSVGWVWDPATFPFTASNPSVARARHAVSIDERRWFFRQNLLRDAGDSQDLKQQWFAGVHSDVGGGYLEADGGLWRAPFDWILAEAKSAGLLVDTARLATVLARSTASATPWNDPQHESLRGAWWPAELFPKLVWRPETKRRSPRLGLGRRRYVAAGQILHPSALRRLHESDYRPSNLLQSFRDYVKSLDTVDGPIPYQDTPAANPMNRT